MSRYQRQFGNAPNLHSASYNPHAKDDTASTANAAALRARKLATLRSEAMALDDRFGFAEFSWDTVLAEYGNKVDPSTVSKRGWVFNILPTTLPATSSSSSSGGFVGGGDDDGDASPQAERSALELFLIDDEGGRFKATVVMEPYFYVVPQDEESSGGSGSGGGNIQEDALELESRHQDLLAALHRRYRPLGLNRVEILRKMDLDAKNHLGVRSQTLGGRPVLKLVFDNVDQLARVKREILEVLKVNRARREERLDFDLQNYNNTYNSSSNNNKEDPLDSILDIREHDVPYTVRACIDLDLRAGCWYTLVPLKSPHGNNGGGGVILTQKDNLQKANPKVLAFDIECTKAPLKFPDADIDSIFMISYMINGQGYL